MVVDDSVEVNIFDVFEVDIDADSITVFFVKGTLSLVSAEFRFFDLDWAGGGSIADVSLTVSQVPDDASFDVSHTADSVTVRYGDIPGTFVLGDFFRIDLEHSPAVALPEPGSLILFGLGLAGLGMAARRRAKGRSDSL